MTKRITVKGVRRQEINVDKLGYALWLLSKAEVERKREEAARDRTARKEATK